MNSKYGYCRFGKKCSKIHFTDICEDNGKCKERYCDKRHPLACFYFEKYKRCKFGDFCSYGHVNNVETDLRNEVKKLRTDVSDLKLKVTELQLKLKNEMKNHVVVVNETSESLQHKCSSADNEALPEKSPEQPETIDETEAIEEEIPETSIRYDMSFENLIKENSWFFCKYCPYKTKKKNGLKIHVGRMHTTGCLYKCKYCEFKSEYGCTYAHMEEIEKHFRLKHGEVVRADPNQNYIDEYKVIYKTTGESMF